MSAGSPNPYESPAPVGEGSGSSSPQPIWDDIELPYDLTIDDLVDFNLFQMRHANANPSRLRQVIGVVVAGSLFLLLNGFLQANLGLGEGGKGSWQNFIIMTLVILAVTGIVMFQTLRQGSTGWSARQKIRSVLMQGDNSDFLGPRRLRVTKDHLEDWSPLSETHWKLEAVYRLVLTPRYAMVFVSANRAFILPVRAFSSPDHMATFLDNLAGHTGKSVERLRD